MRLVKKIKNKKFIKKKKKRERKKERRSALKVLQI
jgi:hypothetical protein